MVFKKMRVEPLQAKDLDEIVAINQISQASGWTKKHFQEELENPFSIQYGVRDAQTNLKGFLFARLITFKNHISLGNEIKFNRTFNTCELFLIAVNPHFSRLGYGSEMLAQLIRTVANKECQEIHLEVRSQNKRAISFYKNFGFEKILTRRGYYTQPVDDALIMVWRIDKTDSE